MIVMQQEHWSEGFWQELLPLVRENWRESPSYEEGLEADPDPVRYQRLDAAGVLLCFTLRTVPARELVGYAIAGVTRSMHHRHMKVGYGDAFYVRKAHRWHAVSLLRLLLAELRKHAVQRVGWFVDKGSPLYDLLLAHDFYEDEVMLELKCS